MKIGFIGLGIMGESMCENIIKKHPETVYVFDQVPEKAALLAAKGAVACETAADVARQADAIITMVPKSEHSQAVYTSITQDLNETKLCIDMSTIDPSVSIDIAKMVKQTGASFIDAPVVKSKPAAIAGKLGIYVGGETADFEKAKDILAYMGENIIHMGENGKGLVMKICHNALVSQIQNGVNETLVLAAKNGVDIDKFVTAVSYGGGQNFYLDGKAQAIKTEDYTTAFSVDNMAKDISICLSLAAECGVSMPGENAAKEVYDKALALGYGSEDFCATIKAVRE